MVDPISAATVGGAVAKAVESAADEGGKGAGGLVARVFGPAADEIGEALRRYTSFRVGNVERIAEAADRKSQGREGIVPPRLAHSILEDGSWCDDELMAEYLGGVLAAGRTPSGKDDRAVTWTKMVTSMSALQLRAHFVLYREWAHALHGRETKFRLSESRHRAQMYVDLESLIPILREVSPDGEINGMLSHVFSGLGRLRMIAGDYQFGQVDVMRPTGSVPAELPYRVAARVTPSVDGMELFGWACGLPGLAPNHFATEPQLVWTEVDVPRPSVFFADLDRED